MTGRERRMLEQIDRIQALLDELRQQIREGSQGRISANEAVQAFADEALRDRDA
jgi:hypothetical protein